MLLAEVRLLRSTLALRRRLHRHCTREVQTQAQYDYPQPEDEAGDPANVLPAGLATPRQVLNLPVGVGRRGKHADQAHSSYASSMTSS